ncbi:unnamed protein product [Vitrella brassicaformis CCMP3155]|uniref:Uncharacterized protein n=1 Tax=Vitrella brassicaformis (strain CCMP3155) TaxID=1169540 RepID=A0A0G4EKT9_VITBC|nr:unnamed protein product [Vitrella brassicaformis CCMP3155]|eukprot:CEL97076.1 unnamed protein product [Vitrella brassicaformis CCMP3155]
MGADLAVQQIKTGHKSKKAATSPRLPYQRQPDGPLTEAERTAIRQSAAGDLEGGIKKHLKGMTKQRRTRRPPRS